MRLEKNLGRIYFTLIFLFALYIRIRFVLDAPFEFKIDAWSMYNYALNIREGLYYGHAFGEFWARYAYWPPLYILITGFIYKFLGEGMGIDVIRLVQAFISAFSCCLVYLITSEAAKGYSKAYREGSLLSALLMCINPRMVVYVNHLYVETLFIFFYLLTAYFLLKHYKYEYMHSRYRYLAIGSFFLGLGNLARPVILLIPLVVFILELLPGGLSLPRFLKTLRTAAVNTAVMFAVMLAVISPWTLRNYLVTGKIILIDTNGPINFYIAHNPLANGKWVDVKPYTDSNSLYVTGYREGASYMLQHPIKELRLAEIKQTLIFTSGDPHVSEARQYLAKSLRIPFVQLPQISVAYLWLISGILLFIALTKLTALKKPGILLREPAWFIGNIMYIDALILAFYFMPRYRIILEPFLICLIGILASLIVSCKTTVEV